MKDVIMRRAIVLIEVILSIASMAGEGLQNIALPVVFVDGAAVENSGDFYEEEGFYYVPEEVAAELGAGERREEDGNVYLTGGGVELELTPGLDYLTANGRYFYWPGGCREEGGRIFVPAIFLTWAFGAPVRYDEEIKCLSFERTGEPIKPGEEFYDGEDLLWLSRIIEAEAGDEPFRGKIAVGNVVLNRVESEGFPDTVEGVVFDKRYGVQFSPAYSGSIYNSPSEESLAAAKLALEGVRIMEDGLYFAATYAASSCWAGRNRPVLGSIGGHVFFA